MREFVRNYLINRKVLFNIPFLILVLFCLWLATRPYPGYYGDARLYLLQALARLDPVAFSDDLFVRYGSQDNFSVFGGILAFAISTVGLHAAAVLLLILGEVVWGAGAAFFACQLFPSFERRAAALIAIVLFPSVYGDTLTFHYGEPFLTPRLYAEALVLAAIAMALRRAWLSAAVLLLGAIALHPVMALPGIGVVFLLATRERRLLWGLPVIGMLAVTGMASFGVEPFVRLRETFSDDWWSIVYERTQLAFPSRWRMEDDFRIVLQVLIGLLAYRHGERAERRLLGAVAAWVGISFTIALLGGDWLRNLLIVNIQLYRATWLFSFVINAAAGVLLFRVFANKSRLRSYFAMALAMYALDRVTSFMLYPAFFLVLIVYIGDIWERRTGAIPKPLELAVFAVALLAGFAALSTAGAIAYVSATGIRGFDNLCDTVAIVLALCACGLYWRRRRLAGTAFGIVAAGAAILAHDQRLPWERFVESDAHPPPAVLSEIDQYKNIYWERGLELTWFNIRRSTYFSCAQGSGIIFYKGTALEYVRRGSALSELNTVDFEPSGGVCIPRRDERGSAPVTAVQLTDVCRSLPDLDMMVLLTEVPEVPKTIWDFAWPQYLYITSPEGVKAVDYHRYYFYRCSDFRTG
jgi:hypothetical protein